MLYFERWDICFYTYIFFTTENSNILLETFTDYLTHNQFRWEVEESFVAMPQSLPDQIISGWCLSLVSFRLPGAYIRVAVESL